MGITTGLRLPCRFCNEHVKAPMTQGLVHSGCADEGHATRSCPLCPCSQQQVYVVQSEALDEFVHAGIDTCPRPLRFGIDHPFQDAHAPIEPVVALIFSLKGGVEQLLACVVFKKGAALQRKHDLCPIVGHNDPMEVWEHHAITASMRVVDPACFLLSVEYHFAFVTNKFFARLLERSQWSQLKLHSSEMALPQNFS
jgi:hypothetical protein